MTQNWLTNKLSYHDPRWMFDSDKIDPGHPSKPPEFRAIEPLSDPNAKYDLGTSAEPWKYFWHPVATLKEFRGHTHGGKGPMSTILLGERVVLVDLTGQIHAFEDRCPHRGASLGLGMVEGDKLRCRYHGWAFDKMAKCVDIPSLMEDDPIPRRAQIKRYDCEVRYDLIWVRLLSGGDTKIPEFPAWDDPTMHCIMGEPYLWPASSGRRVTNFIDVTHFAYGHQGTLGGPPHTRFKPYPIKQHKGRLEFDVDTFLAFNPGDATYGPPTGPDSIMLGPGHYHVTMPFTVVLFFHWSETRSTQIYMHPTPIDAENCRSFWFTCHTKDGSPDEEHLALQSIVLTEDLPIVASQRPRAIGSPRDEIGVPGDKPEIVWRNRLMELARAADKGPEALSKVIGEENDY